MAKTHPLGIPEHNFRPRFKNELYDMVRLTAGTQVGDIHFVEPAKDHDGYWSMKLVHKPTRSYFGVRWPGIFTPDGNVTSISYSPHPVRPEYRSTGTWAHALAHIPVWYKAILDELGTEDRWANAVAVERIAPTIVSDYDTDFTASEVEQIGKSFQAATSEIHQKRLLTPEQLAELTQVLQQRQIAAKSTGRIQWASESARVIAHHLLEKGVDKVNVHAIMNIIGQALNWLNTHLATAGEQIVRYLTDGG